MRLFPSLVLSLLASLAGSLLLRRLSGVSTPGGVADRAGKVGVQVIVIVVPVIGNSLGGRSRRSRRWQRRRIRR